MMGKVSNNKPRTGSDFISSLPPEIFQLILLKLPLKKLLICEQVSRLFQEQVRDEALWRKKIEKYHIVCSCNSSARLAILNFFRPKPMPKPVHEPQIYSYTFRADFLI